MTVDELVAALDAYDGPEVDAMEWPYLDADCDIIDGNLTPVFRWLLDNYEVTPRA